jgi:hypothetical protein
MEKTTKNSGWKKRNEIKSNKINVKYYKKYKQKINEKSI